MTERLTRQELSWLLTQEARGAAERLRKGVQILTKPPPPPPAPKSDRPPGSDRPMTLSSTGMTGLHGTAEEQPEGLESTLDMLDGAMQKLSQIYGPAGPTSQRARKGRVDLAGLLWEIAPDAKVQLEPGAGTDVFGDEAELRRMLHVLVGGGGVQAGVGGAQVVTLKREGDEVRLSVGLGPDTAPVSPAERGWLARMAMRWGGRYELDGGRECLVFPSEEAEQRKEVQVLRKELEAAKAQGEAYARELAAVFTEAGPAMGLSSRPPSMAEELALSSPQVAVSAMAKLSDALADDLRGVLSPLGAARLKNDPAALERVLDASLARGAELLAVVRLMARVGVDVAPVPVDVAQMARDEASLATMAFAARGVVLTNAIGDQPLEHVGLPSALRALFAEMLDRALRASVPGGEIRVGVEPRTSPSGVRGRLLFVEVAEGAPLPERGPEGATEAEPPRSLREGGRAALAYLGEIARAHRITLEVSERRIGVIVPEPVASDT